MKTNKLKKNDEIELTITALSSEGSGIGHYEGLAVFVDSAAVGDILKIHIIKVKSSYAVGKIVKIIKPSKHRITPDCPVYDRCGGCSYSHITYEHELSVKRQRVQDALQRIGGLNLSVDEIIHLEDTNGYRNKAQYPIGFDADGRTVIGFHARKRPRIIDCRSCALQP
ncbi:MAG: class I SAM-dependent RNA methyltransferase, partial [Acutalibacteraceae bacterium]